MLRYQRHIHNNEHHKTIHEDDRNRSGTRTAAVVHVRPTAQVLLFAGGRVDPPQPTVSGSESGARRNTSPVTSTGYSLIGGTNGRADRRANSSDLGLFWRQVR